MKISATLLQSIIITSTFSLAASQCKTVTPLDEFDIIEYTSKKWFIHQLRETPFNTVFTFFCITAEYSFLDPNKGPLVPQGLQNGFDIKVFNSGKDANGNVVTSDDELGEGGVSVPSPLCAAQAAFEGDKDSQLTVGFCSFPVVRFQQSNYWVLAYDEEEGMALIAGGQTDLPNQNGDGLCTYKSPISGLWIFSRSPTRNEDMIEKYRDIARDNGIDPSIMLDVSREDCEDMASPPTKATKSKKSKKSKKSEFKAPKRVKKGKARA